MRTNVAARPFKSNETSKTGDGERTRFEAEACVCTGDFQTRRHLHLQLSDGDAAVFRGKMIAIPPNAADELRALDDNLGQLDALGGCDTTGDDIDTSIEAEDKPGVVPIGDEVAAGQ